MTKWKFTMRHNNHYALYFEFTHAETEEEAKENILSAVIRDDIRKDMEIISISKINDNSRTVICGGATVPHQCHDFTGEYINHLKIKEGDENNDVRETS